MIVYIVFIQKDVFDKWNVHVDVTCVGEYEDQSDNILNSNTPQLAHVLPVKD